MRSSWRTRRRRIARECTAFWWGPKTLEPKLKFLNIKIVQSGSFIFCAMLALTVAGGIQSARAITTTLMPSADSCMRDVAANTNFGESNPLLIGNAKEPFVLHNRALLKFDLTGI